MKNVGFNYFGTIFLLRCSEKPIHLGPSDLWFAATLNLIRSIQNLPGMSHSLTTVRKPVRVKCNSFLLVHNQIKINLI